jgi:hypothetical protein
MEKKNAPAVVAPEPVASEPIASEPVAVEPVASEAVAAEPVASEGGASRRGASVNWASLRADGPLHKIGASLLANEEYVDTYSALRQVCTNWRSDLPEPDVHLHEWIMVEHALPHAVDFSFLHLRTSRYVTIDLTKVHARFKFLHIYRVNPFIFYHKHLSAECYLHQYILDTTSSAFAVASSCLPRRTSRTRYGF